MKVHAFLLFCSLLTFACAPAAATTCADYGNPAHFVDRISVPYPGAGTNGTDLRAIDISWPYAYAGGYALGFGTPYFHIIDLAGVDGPVVASSLAEVGAASFDLEVHGTRVYSVQNDLRIIDVADPYAPTVSGSVDLPTTALAVAVDEGVGLAFVACRDSGLVAVDISDPTAPAIAGTLSFGGGTLVRGVAVDYPYAYLALNGPDGFIVVDVGDPATMVDVASLPPLLYSLSAEGDHVYGVMSDGSGSNDGLRVIDVSDPLAPAVVGTAAGWDLRTIKVAGSLAYADAHIFDVSDPTDPVHVREVNLKVGSPSTSPVAVHDGTIYTAAGGFSSFLGYGIEIGAADAGGPLVPPVGELSEYLVYAMRFRDGLGYVFGEKFSGPSTFSPLMTLLDTSDPSAPSVLGTHQFAAAGQISTIDGDGSHAFVTQTDELVALDVSTPPNLPVAGNLPLDYTPWGSWLDGDYLYLTDREYPDRGLRVYDVSNPGAMVEVGYLEIDALADDGFDVVVRGAYAYIPRGYDYDAGMYGMDIVDVTDPTLPVLAATAPLPGPANNVAFDGELAWVTYGHVHTDHNLRMAAIDVSDPLMPTVVNDIGIPWSTSDIAISGSRLYTVSTSRGPGVIDISDPQQAQAIGSIDAGYGYGFRIAVADDHVYAGSWSGHGSVRIYAPQCAPVGTAAPGTPPFAGAFSLRARPNPFNPAVTLSFELGAPQRVNVTVFDVAGRRVAILLDEALAAGPQAVRWRGVDDAGRAVGSGVYFARVESRYGSQMIKVTLLK